MLEIRELSKSYPGFTLRQVSFDVPDGSIVGFIGRNGAGKTTTLKSVLGLVRPESGSVLWQGRDVLAENCDWKKDVGVVLGDAAFYPKKRLSTITAVTRRFYPNWDEAKYQHYCKVFSLDGNKRMDQLSSGMQVKYLIALALSHNARLLVMDEPTSGLDPVSRDELTELFRAVVADGSRSILFSTHITSDLEKCADRIAFIKDGAIVFSGERTAFMRQFADRGDTLEDIIVSIERRKLDEGAVI